MELFKLLGTIAIDTAEMESAFKKAREDGAQTEENLKGAFSGMGSAAVAFGQTVIAGVAAGATAVAGVVTKAVSAYADYEQLAGGSQLLFGDAYDFIAEKASKAYQTVQMSQNDYLQQVNGFSTGLKTALNGDEQAAAELADRIITAEADVVAATGNSQEAVQNAFNGIMKSNFTMLDNLQLGITPTKEGFQEVIDKVNEWNKANGEATSYQIDNLADCQSALIDYIEMQGLAGYAGKEASETISGSLAMAKGAWENLMSGLAQDNANIPELVSNVVSSGAKVLENIIPVAKEVLKNIPVAISEISPEAGAAFQTIIDICIGAFDVLTAAIKPTFELVSNIFGFLTEHTWVLTAIATAIGVVATAVGMYNVVAAVKAAMAAAEVTTVWALVAAYAAQAAAMIAALAPYLAVAAAIAAVIAVGVLLYKNWDTVVAKAKELYTKVKKFFSDLKDSISDSVNKAKTAAINKFNELKTGAVNKANELKTNVVNRFNELKANATNKISEMKTNAINKFNDLKTGAVQKLADLKNGAVQKFNDIKSNISDKIAGARDAVKNAIDKMKGFFNFTWSLPKIKLPHFKISGEFSLNPPSIPKFSVSWYRKAMDNAMLLNSPTIFGYSGASGQLLGGGEAGSEVVAGSQTLMNMIQNAVSEQNMGLVEVLYKILEAILAMDENMGGNLREALDGVSLSMNRREFARLVKAVN